MHVYALSFGRWHSASGFFFVRERLYRSRHRWTPFVRVRKRYKTWLGFWAREAL